MRCIAQAKIEPRRRTCRIARKGPALAPGKVWPGKSPSAECPCRIPGRPFPGCSSEASGAQERGEDRVDRIEIENIRPIHGLIVRHRHVCGSMPGKALGCGRFHLLGLRMVPGCAIPKSGRYRDAPADGAAWIRGSDPKAGHASQSGNEDNPCSRHCFWRSRVSGDKEGYQEYRYRI